MTLSHKPVLLREVLQVFEGKNLKLFFDGTLGAAGHARAILEEHPEIEKYIGCDRDPIALELASKALEKWGGKSGIGPRRLCRDASLFEEDEDLLRRWIFDRCGCFFNAAGSKRAGIQFYGRRSP